MVFDPTWDDVLAWYKDEKAAREEAEAAGRAAVRMLLLARLGLEEPSELRDDIDAVLATDPAKQWLAEGQDG